MAAIIKMYARMDEVIPILDGDATPAQVRVMFPAGRPGNGRAVYRHVSRGVMGIAENVPVGESTLKEYLWCDFDGDQVCEVLSEWNTALLYMRLNRESLIGDPTPGKRGNYDTLLYSLYRLCWMGNINPTAYLKSL